MGFGEYANFDGLGLAELIRRREVSAAEVLEAAIERVERHDPRLNAVVYRAYDEARRQAAAPLREAAFAGVPFLVKDLNLNVAGMPRTDAVGVHRVAAAAAGVVGLQAVQCIAAGPDRACEHAGRQRGDPQLSLRS